MDRGEWGVGAVRQFRGKHRPCFSASEWRMGKEKALVQSVPSSEKLDYLYLLKLSWVRTFHGYGSTGSRRNCVMGIL